MNILYYISNPTHFDINFCYISKFNAVKCNLTELTTKSTSFTGAVSSLSDICTRQDSSCSWSIGHCSSFVGVLVSVFLNVRVFPECGVSLEAVSRLFFWFYPKFFAERFFCWALLMTHIWGRSTNNSLAAMLDSDQPSPSAPPSLGTNSSPPAVPVTTALTFTLSQQDLTQAFSRVLGNSFPQILTALQSHLTSSGSTTHSWRETRFQVQLPLLTLLVLHCFYPSFGLLFWVPSDLGISCWGSGFPGHEPPFLRAMPSLLGNPPAWRGGSWLVCLDLPAMGAVSI